MPLTPTQRRVFEFIKRRMRSGGEAPTIQEIGRQFDMSSSASVHRILGFLEAEGLIKRVPNVSRGIQLVGAQQAAAFEIDGFYTEDEDSDDFQMDRAPKPKREPAPPPQPVEVLRERQRALEQIRKDFAERMNSWSGVQSEYMRVPRRRSY